MSEQHPPSEDDADTNAAPAVTSPTPLGAQDAEIIAIETAFDGIEMWRFHHHMNGQRSCGRPFTAMQTALVNPAY